MARAQHSPAPWVVANGLQVWIDGHNACSSARVCTLANAALPVDQIDAMTMNANARLIAAAPELLDALNDLMKLPALNDREGMAPDEVGPIMLAVGKAQAARAKATAQS